MTITKQKYKTIKVTAYGVERYWFKSYGIMDHRAYGLKHCTNHLVNGRENHRCQEMYLQNNL